LRTRQKSGKNGEYLSVQGEFVYERGKANEVEGITSGKGNLKNGSSGEVNEGLR